MKPPKNESATRLTPADLGARIADAQARLQALDAERHSLALAAEEGAEGPRRRLLELDKRRGEIVAELERLQSAHVGAKVRQASDDAEMAELSRQKHDDVIRAEAAEARRALAAMKAATDALASEAIKYRAACDRLYASKNGHPGTISGAGIPDLISEPMRGVVTSLAGRVVGIRPNEPFAFRGADGLPMARPWDFPSDDFLLGVPVLGRGVAA